MSNIGVLTVLKS